MEERLQICYECPLFSRKHGGLCDNNLFVNPETGEISLSRKEGFINGCGCILSIKTKNANAICPLNKW